MNTITNILCCVRGLRGEDENRDLQPRRVAFSVYSSQERAKVKVINKQTSKQKKSQPDKLNKPNKNKGAELDPYNFYRV